MPGQKPTIREELTMKTVDALKIATRYVTTGARHGSPSMLQRRLNQEHGLMISHDTALRILAELGAAGIVGSVNTTTHAHPVLLNRDAANEALHAHRSAGNAAAWAELYECPSCCRVAPWLNGRSTKAGDDADEFWCQTCGTESPISACGMVAAGSLR
jgi:hypothetical protein